MADKRTLLELQRRHVGRWVSLAEVKSGITEVPDRTLRRWLSEFVKDGGAERIGDRKGTRYRARAQDKPSSRATTTTFASAVFSEESLALVKRIEAPVYTRSPATYSEAWIDSYIPNQTTYLKADQRSELATIGKRAPIYGRARTYI